MTEKRQLGIYWGDNSFCFVEVEKGKIVNSAHVPFSTPIDTYQSQDIPEGLRSTTLIQKTLQEFKTTSKKISLSLPAKDIIFRSFVIPWMEPEEVRNVVDFEAIKYIPIKLEELSYTYYPIPVTENNQKSIRIIFVATRKDILAKYMGVLEHTGLIVEWAEPSPMSLARALEQKGHLARHHGCAIIQIEPLAGKIIFVDQDVIQFVREFQLPAWDEKNLNDLDLFTARLFNEIRVSLNFYTRQNPQGKIIKIILVSPGDLPNLTKNLTESMNIQANLLTVPSILKTTSGNEIGLLHAFGIALRDKKSQFNNFNLSPKSQQNLAGAGLGSGETQYKMATIAVVLAIAIIGLVFTVTKNMMRKYNQTLAELTTQESPYEASSAADLQAMEKTISNKLTSYKDILMRSNVNFYLARIPQILPQGTWLRSWEMDYNEKRIAEGDLERNISNIALMIEGYAYLENSNEQFRLINSLVAKLKNEKDIANAFEKIDLVTVRQETLGAYPVTYFKIICK